MSHADPIPQLMHFINTELIGNAANPISPDDDLLGGGQIDSMGIMRLVAHLESEFNVSVPPEDVTIENFQSPHAISAYIIASRTEKK